MPDALPSAMRAQNAPKSKTAARERYLKTKKERRKAKKSAGPKPFGEGKKKKDRNAHPSKRRKTEEKEETRQDLQEESGSEESDSEKSDTSSHSSSSSDSSPLPPTERAPPSPPDKEPGYLYRFPRPHQTEASDPDLLSSLGLPEGLSQSTVVDASHTQALSNDTQDQTPTEYLGVTISRSVLRQLTRLGITEWFAVQASVIPLLLDPARETRLYQPYSLPRDLCVSAPTGSGKTLAYTVPIVELLQTRTVVALRALILVPTRDLAMQVAEMFDAIGKGSGLRSLVVTGNRSFRHEQAQLVEQGPTGYSSQVDILIATPGRLVDHVRSTPGFSLHHLRFLVIDEADRLLGQSFHQWVATLLAALTPAESDEITQAPASLDASISAAWAHDELERPLPSVQKLLFSATLSSDPAAMNALQLRDPHYVSVRDQAQGVEGRTDRYTLPAGLHEHMVVTESSTKVLQLLYLLHAKEEPVRHALCFTKSVEAANRLVRLLTYFEERWPGTSLSVQYYSSDLGPGERVQMLRRFQRGEIDLLVCSDLIARGIDLPEVRHVISYDVPVDMAKYVHRVGRTARAGRTGDAWSLVEEQEVFHFKRMLSEAAHLERVVTDKVRPAQWEPFVPTYKVCPLYSPRKRLRSSLPYTAGRHRSVHQPSTSGFFFFFLVFWKLRHPSTRFSLVSSHTLSSSARRLRSASAISRIRRASSSACCRSRMAFRRCSSSSRMSWFVHCLTRSGKLGLRL